MEKKRRILTISTITVVSLIIILGRAKGAKFFANTKKYEFKKNTINQCNQLKDEEKTKKDKKLQLVYDKEFTKIKDTIDYYVKDSKDYGIYYKDLVSKNTYEYNADKPFLAASTIKVSLVMDIADKIQEGKLSKNGSVRYISCDYEGGCGVLQGNTAKLRHPIKYTELMKYAIVYSDNIATHMLLRSSGNLDKYIENICGEKRKSGGNYITAKQQGLILERLYNNSKKNPMYNDIIKNMKNTVFHDRLDKYIPHEICAHKIGDYKSCVHDTGIIFTKNPYIITVYTENRISSADRTISDLSKKIYDIHIESEKEINNIEKDYKKKINEIESKYKNK